MIDLIINGVSVDLSDSGISMLFQRQRTDYTNPTIVKNSFTKTIKLPSTKKNNILFDNIWKLDKYISAGSTFIPSKREPFILLKDGNLVEKGYVKMNNIVYDGDNYTYEITLYGELGNLLYGLSYNINEDTQEVTPMTLGDLTFSFTEFMINRGLIEDAWKRLDGDTSVSAVFDTLNFMVSYDGIPEANNFDAKQMWCSTNRYCNVIWNERLWGPDEFPNYVYIQDENIEYTAVTTMVSRTDPGDFYGLMDLKNEMSVLETRDLRSYLLRPILKIKKVFEAIGNYIEDKYGYDLDMSDPFFSTPEFNNLWMTLSMLYEINPDVETGTIFTKTQLLSNTSSPANYLISFCKIYGIYLDVDYYSKKLVLTRLPRFFDATKINELEIDLSKSVKINPLSFDKATYTFDYGDGESEFLKKYKETYGTKYGSRKVNTGYRFDASTAPYIDKNIFKQGVDSLDQSVYYHYPYCIRNSNLYTYPTALMDDANRPTYKLFNRTKLDQGEVVTLESEMRATLPFVIDGDGWPILFETYNTSGYQFMSDGWGGMKEMIWQDGFPKLQCHSDDNKASDGKDILVSFTGFRQTSYGTIKKSTEKTYWNKDSYIDDTIDATYVNYLLSDDYPRLKRVIGVNCWYDNPRPVEGFTNNYLSVINRLPSFTRCQYEYSKGPGVPVFYNKWVGVNIGLEKCIPLQPSQQYYETYYINWLGSTGRCYSYFTGTYKAHHKYFLAASIKTGSASSFMDYPYPDIIGGTKIDSKDLQNTAEVQLIGSIIDAGDTDRTRACPISAEVTSGQSFNNRVYWFLVFDLTEMELDSKITTVDQALGYFNISLTQAGYPYNILDTLDFGIPQEIYVPATRLKQGIGLYNDYWAKYIADVYSVNTRVMECYCYLDNIDGVFREFYVYDNCLWILSKVTDWNMETKYCKGTFIKVNDIENYITD